MVFASFIYSTVNGSLSSALWGPHEPSQDVFVKPRCSKYDRVIQVSAKLCINYSWVYAINIDMINAMFLKIYSLQFYKRKPRGVGKTKRLTRRKDALLKIAGISRVLAASNQSQ